MTKNTFREANTIATQLWPVFSRLAGVKFKSNNSNNNSAPAAAAAANTFPPFFALEAAHSTLVGMRALVSLAEDSSLEFQFDALRWANEIADGMRRLVVWREMYGG